MRRIWGAGFPKQDYFLNSMQVADSVVVGLDCFRFMASCYGAPKSTLDPSTMNPVISDGSLLPGEKQNLNFFNAGVTYHWQRRRRPATAQRFGGAPMIPV